MRTDDHRHGTEAGNEQHARDGEPACEPCREAKRAASRRRDKRKAMGYRYQMPVGHELYDELILAREQGARLADIAGWAGLAESQVWRIIRGGPEQIVLARTWERLNSAIIRQAITPVGITRRIQALMRLGYSTTRIATEAGCHHDTIRDARDEPRAYLAAWVRTGIADAYDRLSMTPATGETKQFKAGVSRTRNRAIRCNYLPPLAWTNIDDPNDVPDFEAWRPVAQRRTGELVAEWLHLLGLGVSEEHAASQLGVTIEAAKKALERAGAAA